MVWMSDAPGRDWSRRVDQLEEGLPTVIEWTWLPGTIRSGVTHHESGWLRELSAVAQRSLSGSQLPLWPGILQQTF